METIVLGQGIAGGTHFFDEASAEDDLGGGRIYAALVKQAILKRLGKNDATVSQYAEGGAAAEELTLGAEGAIIADTTDKSNIPMQIVCPAGFAADLQEEILSETGTIMELCSIGEFLECFMAVCDQYSVPSWDTFIAWFDGYRGYLNDSTGNATLTITTIDGSQYTGTCQQMAQLTKMSDLFAWMKSCLSAELLSEPTSEMIADNNAEKLGLVFVMTGLDGTYKSYLGLTTATMHFYIRL